MSSENNKPVFKKGATIYLEKKNNNKVQYKTEVFKLRDDGNIEVYPPISDNNLRINFKNGEDIVLYYWYEGSRYFCKTMVLEYINSDEVYSIVLPKRMNKDVTRRWNRYDITVPIVYLKSGDKDDDFISEDKLFLGTTINISGGGAFIVTKKKLNVNDLLGVAFKIGNEVCVIESKVIKIEVTENANVGFDVVLEFYRFSDKDKKYLENVLSKYHKEINN